MELMEAPVSEEVQPGFQLTEVGVIPADWEVCPLSDAVDFLDGKRRPVKDSDRARMQGDIPYYGASGIIDRVDDFLFEEDLILLGEDGENIISRNTPLAFQISGKAWVNNHAHVLRPKPHFHIGFLTAYLESLKYDQYNTGTAQPKLNKLVCATIPIARPTKDEQRAIATALSDADALLSSLEQLIAKKKAIKQGAMQALLMPPGQPGHKRLPGFKGEWEVKKVEDVITDYFSGPSPTCEERNVRGDEWGVLKTTATTWEHGWDWRAHKTLPRSFWGREHIELRARDVIVTKAGPRNRVGVSSWIDFVPPRIIPSGKMIVLRPNQDKVVPFMLSSAIAARPAQVFLDQRTTGMAESQMNYENDALIQCPLLLPSVKEQIAIGEVITDMATEVKAYESKLEKMRMVKQGMLQELLTGKKRLV